MVDVKSKNLYELLGNDHDEDSDKEPQPPVKTVDKPVSRTSKRNVPDTATDQGERHERAGGEHGIRGGRGGRRGGGDGGSYERGAGHMNNRNRSTEDGQDAPRGGYGRGRGGRARGGDRHSRGLAHDHVKQADQSWGANTGSSEWNDEQAGAAIAEDDQKEVIASPTIETAPAVAADVDTTAAIEPPPPEDNSKSYGEYLAELAAKKLKLGDEIKAPRAPNEGSKQEKKWAQAKPLAKAKEDEGEYMPAREEKAKRERQRKEKSTLDIDMRFVEPSRGGSEQRGGRGGGGGSSGGRGRGEGRARGDGDRGRGGYRGRGEGRGEGRGGFRGSRGRGAEPVNMNDTAAFPSLGS